MQQGESAEGISPSSFDKLRTGSESSPARLLESYGEQVEGEEIASARDPSLGLGTPRNDKGVEGEESYVRQLGIFFITSVRLSLGTKNASTSGWRLISPAHNPLNYRDHANHNSQLHAIFGAKVRYGLF